MAKYSTGGTSGSGGGSCELCGKSTENLTETNVAGARLHVCSDCASHGETEKRKRSRRGQSGGTGERNRKKRAAQNVARMSDRAKADSKHWEEEGTNYDDDPLPYLVSGYGDRVAEARQEAGLDLSELADELGVPETDLEAVEQGRATGAGVGGSLIERLEERLDVTLAE